MATGIELATAYVTITAETSQVPKAIDAAIQQGGAAAPKQGRSIGGAIASGLGTALKAGAAAAGGVAALALGTALTKGFERVSAIDDAKGKLAGLGHDAQGVATIMDSALGSVKGTAFGLGDAAGIAASAVAAGIKPGEQLTKYLSLTADAATIAGSSLGEMGSIMNKVSTSGKAYTDNLNQLADRGIPIFQWLQEEYGVTAEELSKMVKDGKVDAETFRKVIEENIGGAALESGKTLRGSFANMQAALGRIGAAAMEPFLPMMKSGLGLITEWADKITPKVKAGAEGLATGLTEMAAAFKTSGESVEGPMTKFEAFGTKAREITDGIAGVWAILSKGDYRGAEQTFGLGEDSKVVEILFTIRDAAIALWAALTSPSAEKFTEFLDTVKVTGETASGAMGKVEGASSNLSAGLLKLGSAAADGAGALLGLGGDTAQVAVTGIKAAGNVMGFFADNTTLATAALAALAGGFVIAEVAQTGFHIARIAQAMMTPAEIASRMAMTRAIVAQTAVMRAHVVALGGEAPVQQLTTRQRLAATIARQRETAATVAATSALGMYARAHAVAAAQAGLLGRAMHTTAGAAATVASRVQGLATVAMGGLRSAASGLMGMLGGPFGLALAGVATGLMIWHTQAQKTKQRNDEIARSAEDLGKVLYETNGVLTETGQKAAAASLEQLKLAGTGRSMIEYLESVGVAGKTAAQGLAGSQSAMQSTLKVLEEQAAAEKALNEERIRGEGFGSTGLGQLLNWGGARDKNNEAQNALADYQKINDAAQKFAESQRRIKESTGQIDASGTATSIGTMSEAMARFSESTGGAASKVDILNGGLSTLRGDQLSVEDAQQRVNDALRGFSEAATNGGAAAVNAAGQIDTSTSAGSRLYDAMKSVQTAFDQAGASAYQSALQQGKSHQDAAAEAEAASQRVRDEFIKQQTDAGMTLELATALADQYRLFPADIKTNVSLIGYDEAQQKLLALSDDATKKIYVEYWDAQQRFWDSGQQGPVAWPSGPPAVPRRASGGPLFASDGKVTGAGGPTSDSVFAMLSDDEHVWSAQEVAGAGGHGAMARLRAMARQGLLPAFARGGPIVQSMVSAVQKKFPGMSFTSGLRYSDDGYHSKDQAADFSNTGAGMPSTPQMQALAAWIADNYAGITLQLIHSPFGRNIGQGQGYVGDGVGFYGSGTMAEHQDHVHWAVSQEVGEPTGPLAMNQIDGMKPAVEWTEKDELALESARISVVQAKEARDKVHANEKKSQADRDQADVKVARAELKVRELENKRDGKAGVEAIVTPAPELTGEMDEETLTIRRAEIAILDAQLARDKTYSDPESTSMDKEKADIAVYDARNNLESTKARIEEQKERDEEKSKSGSNKDGWTTETLRDRVASYGSQVAGILFDSALEVFGIESRWLDIPWPKYELESAKDKSSDKKKDKSKGKDKALPSKRGDAADGGGSPPDPLADLLPGGKPGPKDFAWAMPSTGGGNPKWIEKLLKKGPKVYDQGGWLNPNEMAINLGSRPEPVFTPAEFDNIAQIASLDSLEVAPPPVNDYSIRIIEPKFANESRLIRSATDAQSRQMMRYGGRVV